MRVIWLLLLVPQIFLGYLLGIVDAELGTPHTEGGLSVYFALPSWLLFVGASVAASEMWRGRLNFQRVKRCVSVRRCTILELRLTLALLAGVVLAYATSCLGFALGARRVTVAVSVHLNWPPDFKNMIPLWSQPATSVHDCVMAARMAAGVFADPWDPARDERTVLVTAANSGYVELLENWMCHMRSQGLLFMVIAMDEHIFRYMAREHPGQPTCLFHTKRTDRRLSFSWQNNFGGQEFNDLTCGKIEVAQSLLSAGLNVLFADADARPKSGRPHLFREVLNASCDYTYQQNVRDDVTYTPGPEIEGNTGFYFARAGAPMVSLFEEANANCVRFQKFDDQTNFWNALISQHRLGVALYDNSSITGAAGTPRRAGQSLIRPRLDQLVYCPLDLHRFASGFAFLQLNAEGEDPFPYHPEKSERAELLHSNYMTGIPRKQKYWKLAGLWGCNASISAAPSIRSDFAVAVNMLGQKFNAYQCATSKGAIQMEGGGMGSLVQLAVAKLANVCASGVLPVTRGPLRAYTNNPQCAAAGSSNDGWKCFFRPMGSCEAVGDEVTIGPHSQLPRALRQCAVPGLKDSFSPGTDAAFWWGALHAYAMRPNARTHAMLQRFRAQWGLEKIHIAMHVRLGDKTHDGASRQHGKAVAVGDYLRQAEKMLAWMEAECVSEQRKCGPFVVYVATDSVQAATDAIRWGNNGANTLGLRTQGRHAVRVVAPNATRSQALSGANKEIAAELEREELRASVAHDVAREVVADLYMLAGAERLVGLVMSQMARIAAAVGLARGSMVQAVAMDPENLGVEDFAKLGEAEGWSRPL